VTSRRLAAWFLAAAAAVLLAACSTADFAYRNARLLYDNAPTWMLWNVDDYLELTAEQKDLARERLENALAWHRREVLPGYATFLQDFERQVDAGLDEASLRQDQERLRAYYRQIAQHLLPDTADLFALLDAAQVEDLARRLDKADGKVLEEARVLRERGIGKTLAHLEAWTGALSSAQRDLVKSRMRAFPDTTALRVAEWRARQAKLLALMRARPPRDAMVPALDALLFDVDAWRDPAYAQALQKRDDMTIAMLADLAHTLTPEQVASIKARIRGLLTDIAQATRAS
jgi:hypothetical protein